ncbi:glycosyltransferase family A protein [Flavobacterium sp.]|uniref:glycosyltransferase family A protein n=1 Tax=Flavobacterium sp. TaxID=239 RepID=UPI00286EABBA|nr:glycosyltransferase family A protein [Flavobacterium sp.]
MRIGSNPNIHKTIDLSSKSHRVIIPVYIPNAEGYFTDAFAVFKVCIASLLKTINEDTVITLISNASSDEVNQYIYQLWKDKKIDKAVFNKENVGKMNAIIAETRASFEEFITYSDADVFFDKGWLKETFSIFKNFSKAGFVSMNPMPGSYGYASSAIIDAFFSGNIKISQSSTVCDFQDLEHFHKSIGRDHQATEELYDKQIIYFTKNDVSTLVGAGHFCCTIRKTPTLKYVPIKKSNIAVSGGSETIYLDLPFEKTGLWKLSSTKSYVWHMGNVLEKEWSTKKLESISSFKEENFSFHSCMSYSKFLVSNWIPNPLKSKVVGIIKKIKAIK